MICTYLPDGSRCNVTFPGTLHVLELKINLIAVIIFTAPGAGYETLFDGGAKLINAFGAILG